MSRVTTVYVGPYAEWRVAEEMDTPTDETGNEWLFTGALCPMIRPRGNSSDASRVDGGYRFCYAAEDRKRGGGIAREVWYSGQPPPPEVVDLSQIDPRAELDWFARAFGEELAVLSGHFGGQPVCRWGVIVSWD